MDVDLSWKIDTSVAVIVSSVSDGFEEDFYSRETASND